MSIPMIRGKSQLCNHGQIGNTFETKKKNCPQSNQYIYGGFDHLSSPQYLNITIDQTFAILQ